MIKHILLISLSLFLFACGSALEEASVKPSLSSFPDDEASSNVASTANGKAHWAKLPVKVMLDKALSDSDIFAIESAIDKWENATGLNLIEIQSDKSKKSNISLQSQIRSDAENGFYAASNWKTLGFSRNTLAVTTWSEIRTNSSTIQITEADISFNKVDYEMIDGLSLGEKLEVDIESVAVHEIGHFLGLTHSSRDLDSESVMNTSLKVGRGYSNRELSDGDKFEIRARYGCVMSENSSCE